MTSSSQDWRRYWSDRTFDPSAGLELGHLLAAGGTGCAAGGVGEDAWRTFVADVADILEIGPDTSVFDVGCGAGAFLAPLHGIGCRVGGIDLSPALVAGARAAMPGADVSVGDASALDPADPWDVVLSMGAFGCFPDHAYARGVLARMAAKATRAVAVLDVPDEADRAEALGAGGGATGEPEPLFYPRGWFLRQLAEIGLTAVQIGDQRIAGYAAGRFRFNVFGKV
ncbi:MAG: trans-aconitate 2-methyltransferase [Vicinamibacterales bacterium]